MRIYYFEHVEVLKMELEKSLNEHIATEGNKDRCDIDDEKKGEWALKKINEAKNEIEKRASYAEREITRVEDWEKKEKDKYVDSIDYFTSLLAEYANKNDVKSHALPSG